MADSVPETGIFTFETMVHIIGEYLQIIFIDSKLGTSTCVHSLNLVRSLLQSRFYYFYICIDNVVVTCENENRKNLGLHYPNSRNNIRNSKRFVTWSCLGNSKHL